MSSRPRLLALMGSGETSPTMVKTHRELLARVGGAPAVLLDTPFGFQANAADLTARAQTYFRDSVGTPLALASYTSAAELGTVAHEATLASIRAAGYVFAGPGSPTYALEQWAQSTVPQLLRQKLADGGCLTFASAAALTVGVATVPVYEIYKVGAPAAWAEGLDLLRETGLRAAVVPHFNNAEGGNHDTRFCYLGEPRLAIMERQLPGDAFVLGIDEHTGVVIDLDAGEATVVGLGVLTVRTAGRSRTFASGTTVSVERLREVADELRKGEDDEGRPRRTVGAPDAGASPPSERVEGGGAGDGDPVTTGGPLLQAVAAHARAFDTALDAGDVEAAAQTMLDLESDLWSWAADTLQSDELDQGRAALRSMVVRLAGVAEAGTKDPRAVVGPFVELLLGLREGARVARRYADADAVRDGLTGLGVEVRDTAAGTEWTVG